MPLSSTKRPCLASAIAAPSANIFSNGRSVTGTSGSSSKKVSWLTASVGFNSLLKKSNCCWLKNSNARPFALRRKPLACSKVTKSSQLKGVLSKSILILSWISVWAAMASNSLALSSIAFTPGISICAPKASAKFWQCVKKSDNSKTSMGPCRFASWIANWSSL